MNQSHQHKKPARSARLPDGRAGWFDGSRDGQLVGWAVRPDGATAVVRLRRGATTIRLVADRYRADVQVAGHGDGYCGFSASLSQLSGGDEPIACVWADSDEPLPGSPWSPPIKTAPARLLRRRGLTIALDRPIAGLEAITGYGFDPQNPMRRLSLALEQGGRRMAVTRSCLFRRDAILPGGDGFHGFHFSPSAIAAAPGDGLSLWDAEQGLRLCWIRERRR